MLEKKFLKFLSKLKTFVIPLFISNSQKVQLVYEYILPLRYNRLDFI